MTVSSLLDSGFNVVAIPDKDREINGVYIGDLLSWVMSSAESNNAWVTIMTNINVVAVASLVDVSCIILAEGVALGEDVIAQAEAKGINILSTEMTSYEVAKALSVLGI